MLIDTHAHLNFNAFDKDRNKVIKNCLENKIEIINIGTDFETSKKAIEVAVKYEKGVNCAIGLHPTNLDTNLIKIKIDKCEGSHFEKEFDYAKYKNFILEDKWKKIVAIGEIGLDYLNLPKSKTKKNLLKKEQKKLFEKQLGLAKEFGLPVILHCRMAIDDIIEILSKKVFSNLSGTIHCFTGNLKQARKFLEMGFYIGLNGIIFKLDLDKVIKIIPIDRILLETDCPYLTPPSFKEKRNNPLAVKHIAQKISDIKKLDYNHIEKITTKNAKKLFNI